MNIVHVTPHLPPDQAANALLPYQLGEWAAARGDVGAVHRASAAHRRMRRAPGRSHLDSAHEAHAAQRTCDVPRSIAGAVAHPACGRAAHRRRRRCPRAQQRPAAEVARWLAHRLGKPFVLTLYGTEIWHYRPQARDRPVHARLPRRLRRHVLQPATARPCARELGLARPECHVIYPPVAASFVFHDWAAQQEARLGSA